MVCLGNICRSPTAHGVLEKMTENRGLAGKIAVDSAGTSTYHLGDHPDPRSIAAAEQRGYSLHEQTARQVRESDFHEFDYILAMDTSNLANLERVQPEQSKARLQLLLEYTPDSVESVPDPYFGNQGEGFERVLDLIEAACHKLLQQLENELQATKTET